MSIETKKAPGTGTDGNRYVVILTGPAQFIGTDDSGRPIHAFTMLLHSWSVEGYTGTISRPGKGRFYLDGTGVEVTLNEPSIDPTP